MESLSSHDGDMVTRVCNYTEVDISFAPVPQLLSVEAIYPFIAVNGQIAYHTAQNVCAISNSLNWAEGGNLLIYPSFLAAWVRRSAEKQRGGTKIAYLANDIAAYYDRAGFQQGYSHALDGKLST